MNSIIKFKRTSIPSKIPESTDLINEGEIFINTNDEKVFVSKGDGNSFVLSPNKDLIENDLPAITTVAPEESSTQTTAGSRTIGSQFKILIDNVAKLFTGKVDKITSTANAITSFSNSSGDIKTNTSYIDDMHLGVGVEPYVWDDVFGTVDLLAGGALFSGTTATILNNNAYFDGTNWKYKTDSTIGQLRVGADGTLQMYTAPTGVAGATATLTNTLSLSNSGVLTVNSIETATNGKYYTRGIGTSGIAQVTYYPLFPSANDTITLPVGVYKISMSFYVSVATSTVSSALNLSIRGAGTAAGNVYGTSRGCTAYNGALVQYILNSTIANSNAVTANSAVAGRTYIVHVEAIMDITTAGTIIPSYLWGSNLTNGTVTLNSANNMIIEKVSNTQTTNVGWN